jgi:hypothetical protein
MLSISCLEAETLRPAPDLTTEELLPFWELPTRRQKRNLSWTLVDVLRHYGHDAEDFAQEIAIALWQTEKTVLCQQRTGLVVPECASLFETYQRWTFRNLIRPFRKKKRGERVIPYSDPRWQYPTDRAPFLSQECEQHSVVSISDLTDSAAYAHNPEIRLSFRVDLTRLLDQMRGYPRPLVLAAFGCIPPRQAVNVSGLREQRAWEMLGEIREQARFFLREYACGSRAGSLPRTGSHSRRNGLIYRRGSTDNPSRPPL